ncbi:MAG: LuxE/PaaK family acyltransferase [Candidatus Xenobia bacterium]
MSAVDTLIANPAAFDFTPEADAQFLAAMQVAFRRHHAECMEYRGLCDRQGFSPAHLRTVADLPQIPWLFVPVLKRHVLMSVPPERVKLTLSSSGTSGEKSAIYLDDTTLSRIRRIVFNIYAAFGMHNPELATNYLCFTYDPKIAADVGTAWSDKLLTGLTRVGNVFYAIKQKEGEWQLDREAVWRALERFANSGRPLRILGFPSFTWEVVGEYVRQTGRTFNFGPQSWIITGGGWKTLADREIPRDEFRRKASEWLGMPPTNVRDLFGMVEHGVPYCECEAGRLHVPIYARAWARDPGTLQVLPPGERGLLHLMTPYLNSFPAISLLTTDLGRVETDCPCGRSAPTLTLEGRAGTVRHKGCAIAALDVLSEATDQREALDRRSERGAERLPSGSHAALPHGRTERFETEAAS